MTQILSPTLDHLAAAWSPVAGSRRFHGRYFNSDPDFSPDGKSLLYASDRSGTADLWLHDLGTGKNSRLSGLPGAQTAPRYSPDGKQLAYQDQDGIAWCSTWHPGRSASSHPRCSSRAG